MLTRQKLISEINSKLAWIKASVELNCSLNLLDCNIHMEHFLIGLLNRVYGYSLVNLNAEESNFISIDLGDREKRIAIQVTSDNTSTKIKETLKKFFENHYERDFDTLIIVIIGSKKNYTAEFKTENGFVFSQEQHVWDFTKIYQDIGNKGTEDIREIANYLSRELAPSNGYVGTGPFSVVTDMNKKVRALCESKLMTAGVIRETAESIIQEDIETGKYQYILDEARLGRRYLIGGFGSGKSHAVLVLCQYLLDVYASGAVDSIPLYAHARELRSAGSIEAWIETKPIHGTKYILFIDGLDEVDYMLAANLIEEERYLSSLNPNNLIIICSRPMTYLPDKSIQIQIHCLDESEQKILVGKISEKAAMYFKPNSLTEEMRACIKLPLFCIIYAIQRGSDSLGFAKNKIDLITVFVDKALKKISETNKSAYNDLLNLSICATKADYGDIHLSDVTLTESIDTLLKTGLVEVESDYLSFPLAIVPQFLAAKALQLNKIDYTVITSSKDSIYRWKYALAILFSQSPFEETFDLFSTVFCAAPGLAAQIISDGTRSDRCDSLPIELECGNNLIRCMVVWEKALGPLCKYLVPKNKDNKYSICVAANGCSLAHSWHSASLTEEVTVKTFKEMMHMPGMHAGPVPAQSNWPWVVTFKMLADHLTDCINDRRILGSGQQLAKEYFWHNAVILADKGSLCHDPIPVSAFDSYKTYGDCILKIKNKLIDLPIFFSFLQVYADDQTSSVCPPFPVGDQEYSSYVWSCYSQERFLELTRFVFSSALNEYAALMASDFSCLAGEMYTSQLMPCILVGNLDFNSESIHGPVLSWYLLTLDHKETNKVDIDYRDDSSDADEVIRSIYENHRSNRSGLKAEGFIRTSQAIDLNCPTPVTKIVYEWLRQELKKLGWINLF